MNNISNRDIRIYQEIDGSAVANTFTIVGGAPGWVDTDISGSDVPALAKGVCVLMTPSAGQECGARADGSVNDRRCYVTVDRSFTQCAHTSTRVIEFYKQAANCVYNIIGYWL